MENNCGVYHESQQITDCIKLDVKYKLFKSILYEPYFMLPLIKGRLLIVIENFIKIKIVCN